MFNKKVGQNGKNFVLWLVVVWPVEHCWILFIAAISLFIFEATDMLRSSVTAIGSGVRVRRVQVLSNSNLYCS